ncbi:MAG TPA: sensor histidine kinase [Croceibacterium sp.]
MSDRTFLYSKNSEAKQPEGFLAFASSYDSLAEINHRISNNLALLASTVSMRAAGFSRRKAPVDGHEVATALHEITARIAIVGHMHRLLSTRPGSDHAQFGPHLRELCRLFISALSAPDQWELVESDIDDCSVPADRFLPLSLIVTEVVTNALKYAHPARVPGKLTVGCRCEADGAIVVEVSDDGVGFPEGFELAAGGGIGSRTIHVLAQQIDAELRFDSHATGLRFELRLPPSAESAGF